MANNHHTTFAMCLVDINCLTIKHDSDICLSVIAHGLKKKDIKFVLRLVVLSDAFGAGQSRHRVPYMCMCTCMCLFMHITSHHYHIMITPLSHHYHVIPHLVILD